MAQHSPAATNDVRRQLGTTELRVSPVGLGCWPISGMTTLNTSRADSLATISACFDLGINLLDTAYCYGAEGESERLIAAAVGDRRDEFVIATKGGVHWSSRGERVLDARPATLRRECDESLRRLQTDRVDLLYLHAPDPATPLVVSAEALRQLRDAGKTRAVGLSNATVAQMREFHQVCPLSAVQPPYNMLQRDIERECVPWCQSQQVSVIVYWPLMKGLLAGKMPRDHVFDPRDGRAKYPMFQGEEWQRNQDFVEQLRHIAESAGVTIAQLVVNWTIHQPGITTALCGAKRAAQIAETAQAMTWQLTPGQRERIAAALQARGTAVTKNAI